MAVETALTVKTVEKNGISVINKLILHPNFSYKYLAVNMEAKYGS